MTDGITREQYWNEIKSIARDALDESRGDLEKADEYVHETVDGHEWVIYYAHNADVISYTENEHAVEDLGPEEISRAMSEGGTSRVLMIIAFFAMRADVMDHVHALSDTLTPEFYDAKGRIGEMTGSDLAGLLAHFECSTVADLEQAMEDGEVDPQDVLDWEVKGED